MKYGDIASSQTYLRFEQPSSDVTSVRQFQRVVKAYPNRVHRQPEHPRK